MSEQLVPPELLGSVVNYFRPQRIILFGSAARGEAGPESDLDLVVVRDDDAPSEKLTARAVAEARAGYHAPVDIIPCRAGKLYSRAPAIGSFAHQVLRDGIPVYDRE
jgi:predicted nucleotidyltransferase